MAVTGEKRTSGAAEAPALATPASKRRRLSDASVLCVRELFRAMVRDGNISTEERIILQNAAVLLSQVKGDTWVTFPDNDGLLRDLNLTRQQTNRLRSFLDRVAEQIKLKNTNLPSEGSDVPEKLQLATVPWAASVNSLELLHCLVPEVELVETGTFGWIERITNLLPAQFMLRIRAKELINHYYLKYHKPEPKQETPATSSSDAEPATPGRFASIKARGVVVARITMSPLQFCIRVIARVVVVVIEYISFHYFTVSRIITKFFPFWPFLSFSLLAISHGRAIRFFEFIVLFARWRVILCLASYSTFFGTVFYPFVYIADNFLKWKEGLTPKIMGCACEVGDSTVPSILAFIPVESVNAIMWLLKRLTWLPLPSFVAFQIDVFIDHLQPVLIMVFDLMFSIGVAEGLATILSFADGWTQPKLVLMSMDVARRIRDGSLEGKPHGSEASAASEEPHPASSHNVATTLPVWREDGAWSVFDPSQ
mmetsp:Transcript_141346/g.249673  ORF Transcript_141346/g.249673 Transcript_141346/m.249673 type:complete len:482 (-) Transcript_141346:52-1497(-)